MTLKDIYHRFRKGDFGLFYALTEQERLEILEMYMREMTLQLNGAKNANNFLKLEGVDTSERRVGKIEAPLNQKEQGDAM